MNDHTEILPKPLEYGSALVRAMIGSEPINNLPEDIRAAFTRVQGHYLAELLEYVLTVQTDKGYDRATLVNTLMEVAERWNK